MLNVAPGFPNSAIITWNNGLTTLAPLSGPSDVEQDGTRRMSRIEVP